MSLTAEYEEILVALAQSPQSLDTLHATTKLPYRDLNRLVLDLRCKGRVVATQERIKGQGKVTIYSLKLQG